MLRSITLACLLGCAGTAFAQPILPDPLQYQLTATLKLGAPDHWDYLAYDDNTQRLFIAHGTQVTVVATSMPRTPHPQSQVMSIVGVIDGLDGAHGIAIVPGGQGYAASGKTNSVIAFDLATLKPARSIAAGPGPDALAYDPSSQHLFVMNGQAGRITVINTQSNSAIANITTGGQLEAAGADGQGNLFVNQVDTGSLLRIDTARNTVTARWKLPDCQSPHGLALDQWNHHVFVSCLNAKLLVVNGGSGQVVAQVAIGLGSDTVTYDADRHLVFSSNGDGTLSAMSAVSFLALAPLTTAPGARTMAIDPVSGRVFLVTADIDGAVAKTDSGAWPKLSFKPDTLKLLVYSPAS